MWHWHASLFCTIEFSVLPVDTTPSCGLWNLPTTHYSMWHWNDSLFYTIKFSVLSVDTTTPFVVYGIFQLHIILCDTDVTHFSTQLNFLSYLLMPQRFLWSVESSNYAQLHVILTWFTFLHNSIFCLVTCWYHNSFSSLWTLPTMHLTPRSTDRINTVSYLNTTTYAVMESCSYSLYRTPCDRHQHNILCVLPVLLLFPMLYGIFQLWKPGEKLKHIDWNGPLNTKTMLKRVQSLIQGKNQTK